MDQHRQCAEDTALKVRCRLREEWIVNRALYAGARSALANSPSWQCGVLSRLGGGRCMKWESHGESFVVRFSLQLGAHSLRGRRWELRR